MTQRPHAVGAHVRQVHGLDWSDRLTAMLRYWITLVIDGGGSSVAADPATPLTRIFDELLARR
jgi:hypothetical protein